MTMGGFRHQWSGATWLYSGEILNRTNGLDGDGCLHRLCAFHYLKRCRESSRWADPDFCDVGRLEALRNFLGRDAVTL
jgi:hypothetical protein